MFIMTREDALEVIYMHMPPLAGDDTRFLVVGGVQVRQLAEQELRPKELSDMKRHLSRSSNSDPIDHRIRVRKIILDIVLPSFRQTSCARIAGVSDFDSFDRVAHHGRAGPHEVSYSIAIEIAVFLPQAYGGT
jgi:hypothetical protein